VVKTSGRKLPAALDWRLDVTDFGRVEQASITMAPLVLLVGRNNSGKSYVASLLWSFLNIDESWLDRRPVPPAWFEQLLIKAEADQPVSAIMLQGWLNELVVAKKDSVARNLLSYDEATVKSVVVTFGSSKSCMFRNENGDPEAIEGALRRRLQHISNGGVVVRYAFSEKEEEQAPDWIKSALVSDAVEAMMFGQRGFPRARPIYLPAARTGLMLSLPFIIGDLLGSLGIEEDDRTTARLPQPTIQFLRQVVNAKGSPRSELVEVAAFLERELLRGQVTRNESASPTFSYTPESGDPIPLHTASSMISELAPFLLLLRSSPLDRGLIFEEPESHLHLSAQRQVARAIARLVNLGVPVVVTTHSDTFLQQLNILIALNGHPDQAELMARYGYTAEDILDPAHVKGYEFVDTDQGRSRVEPLEMIETGLIVSTLNDVLIELSREAIATQERE